MFFTSTFAASPDFFIVVLTFFFAILVGCILLDHCNAYKMQSANPKELTAADRPSPAPSNARVFPLFSELHEDLMINILSYIADIPLERPLAKPRSTVTGVLPLVSRLFRQFCSSDYFWQSSMKRMRLRDSYLWEPGILKLLPPGTIPEDDPLEQVHNLLQLDYKSIYRRVVDSHVRCTAPVFFMTGHVRLGHTIQLHFFEPRYRLLIALAMDGWPESARRGAPICANRQGEWPTFLYAFKSELRPGALACLVQVKQCLIYPDGTADVSLLVHAYVRLEQVWERPHSSRLYEATGFRMGREESRQMERPGRGGLASHDLNAILGAYGNAMHVVVSGLARYTAADDDDDDDDDDDVEDEDDDDDDDEEDEWIPE
jgi:hypothetical protein